MKSFSTFLILVSVAFSASGSGSSCKIGAADWKITCSLLSKEVPAISAEIVYQSYRLDQDETSGDICPKEGTHELSGIVSLTRSDKPANLNMVDWLTSTILEVARPHTRKLDLMFFPFDLQEATTDEYHHMATFYKKGDRIFLNMDLIVTLPAHEVEHGESTTLTFQNTQVRCRVKNLPPEFQAP